MRVRRVGRLSTRGRIGWRLGLGLLGAQLLVLLAYSWFQWHRSGLGVDFAEFNQTAWLLHTGDLAPYSSVIQRPFLLDHFSLLMWPLALLYSIYPHGITLLWLQDLAIVGIGVVVVRWVAEVVDAEREGPVAVLHRHAGVVVVATALVFVANPWLYTAASFDFHFEAFAALFVVLAARSAWHGRRLAALAWILLTVLTADYGGLYVACLGVGMLGVRRLRPVALVAVALGIAWLEITKLAGTTGWTALGGYGYIITGGSPVPPGQLTLTNVVRAALVHPARWWDVLWQRRTVVYQVLAPTALLGLFRPAVFLFCLLVFGTAAILGPEIFLLSGFQYIAGYAVALPATVLGVRWLLRRYGARRVVRRLLAVVAAALAVQAVVVGIVLIPRVPRYWIRITAAEAATIRQAAARLPQSDEVVAAWGVEGRFSGRRWMYPYEELPQKVPVRAPVVDFVMAPAIGIEASVPADGEAAITYIRTTLHARVLLDRNGLTVLRWRPPRAVIGTTIQLGTHAVP